MPGISKHKKVSSGAAASVIHNGLSGQAYGITQNFKRAEEYMEKRYCLNCQEQLPFFTPTRLVFKGKFCNPGCKAMWMKDQGRIKPKQVRKKYRRRYA